MRVSLFFFFFTAFCCFTLLLSCEPDEELLITNPEEEGGGTVGSDPDQSSVALTFNGSIDLADPHNYGSQTIPNYIQRDNTEDNPITDATATLGRVLFYDQELSATRTISCSSCHQQEVAFGDVAVVSEGVSGTTGRHSMRLVNARFGDEARFFWDERARTLEDQSTEPIRDHIEMGFSGADGDPDFDDLIDRMENIGYYSELFANAFGTTQVTEDRIQRSLAQFIRSLQSFDTKYDVGRAQVNNNNADFPNFTEEENRGKALFMADARFDNQGVRIGGGIGCNDCHQAPEFSIDNGSNNNGVIGNLLGGTDLTITRSPSLREVFRPNGQDNGPFMHDGSLATINDVLSHYNNGIQNNQNLDRSLQSNGNPQRLNLTDAEREAVIAFLRTLTGNNVYEDERWANPFGQD